MMRFAQALTSLTALLVFSCSRVSENASVLPTAVAYNPGDTVREDIQRLSNIGRLEVWLEGCVGSSRIESSAGLEKSLKYFGELDLAQIHLLKKKLGDDSIRLHDFRFECDNSVIVGFDDRGLQTSIFPSAFAPK